MAHFAQIDNNNIVTQVLVVPNEEEHRGEDFLSNELGLGGRWIQTSYNGNIRKMFAGVGYTYNETLDIFLPPKPFESWVLNETLGQWDAPIERPIVDEDKAAIWDENTQTWSIVDRPLAIIENPNPYPNE
jgi:hypothetical protein